MKKLFIQAFSFFGISGIGWIVDMCFYSFLLWIKINTTVSNIFSSLIAITLVYFLSTRKIFSNNGSLSLRKKYTMYVGYQICMILLSSFIIGQIDQIFLVSTIKVFAKFSGVFAKILVTPFTMVTNFIVMKFLIEKL